MATICPFLGSDCVEDKCKMWRDGDCLIPAFLSTSIVRNIQELSQDDDFDDDELDEDEIDEEDFEDDEEEDEEDEEDEDEDDETAK